MPQASFATVHAAFAEAVRRWPDNGFVCAPPAPERDYHPAGVELTFRQVFDGAEALRRRYAAAGYGHRHRVALLPEQRPEFFCHYLALNALGASIVPINPDYRHDEMCYQMQHSEAQLAVTLAKRQDDLRRVAATLDRALPVVGFEALPERLPPPAAPAANDPPGPASEAALLYTSGTTGRPKGCVLSNEYVLTSGAWYRDTGGLLTIRPGVERIYNPLPLFHMNCLIGTATALMLSGGCLILPARFQPARWWPDLVATRATACHYLGIVAPVLLNQPPVPEETEHAVRFGLGAGIEPELHAAFETRFGFPLVEVWGMTETGRFLTNHLEPRRVETRAFGRPRDGLLAKVVDDSEQEVPAGQEGELLVRSAGDEPRRGFFSGYLKNEAATEEAWRGGWFHTGDVVRQDAEGMLYFVDRKRNIIRRSGENIAGAEVEACLQAHPEVAQVAVLAVPDALRDEEVLACVVAMPGAAGDAAQAVRLFDWCFERLAYYKAPGWLVFVDGLPTTGTQKIQKQNIFPPGQDPRARPDAHDLRSRKKRR
ncbi:MAG: ATP-dependent acyl-CoA ligase [Alphaproteobacteria bacterium]|nr:ATP-dependent acyl-CoA ligase [Alphaproteobacteria bacterium]